MSLAHIRLIQTRQDAGTAEYNVESPDFCSPPQWQAIGELLLRKAEKRYEFRPSAIWTEKKAIPPEVYASDEAERTRLLASKYRGFGWGAWAMIVHGYASQFLKSENYPEKHPATFFPDR
jgi:hypothetical protein